MLIFPVNIGFKVYILLISFVLIVFSAFAYTYYSDFLAGEIKNIKILTPENFKGGLTAVHENADTIKPTEVVELKDGDTFDLEATIVTQEVGNRLVKRLAYNGQIPGPVLKVERGSKITVNFKNSIDMETALHSHGLRGNFKMDGAVPISQDPIPVGGTFTYELEFPDTGVFWYHPHIREDYQQGLGLYGNFIVSEDNYWNAVDKEEYIILDDVLENGDFDPKIVTHTLMGRYGDKILINDREDFSVKVTQGEISRFFLTNVANTRTFELSFEGAFVKEVGGDNGRAENEVVVEKTVIGPSERYVLELMYQDAGTYPILNRGEKIGEVVVEPSNVFKLSEFKKLRTNASDYGDIRNNLVALLKQEPDKKLRLDIELKNTSSDTASLGQVDGEGNVMVMGVKMTKEQGIEHCKVMPQMAECVALAGDGKGEVVSLDGKEMTRVQARQYCQLKPDVDGCTAYQVDGVPLMQMHAHPDGIEWEDQMVEVNQMSTNETIEWIIEDELTGKKNGAIDWSFAKGDMVKVRVFNDGKGLHPMQHPLHFHGQRFVVLGRDGVANENLQWKDTVLIPMGQTVDLLIDMSNSGIWMSHCHIAEHLSSGMMFNFEVK
jgi:FtsP/CotA-like multicopper oxidase with cupredoxin domain